MISSTFPGTPTGALEILINITPIEEFLLAEAARGFAMRQENSYLCCKCQLTE